MGSSNKETQTYFLFQHYKVELFNSLTARPSRTWGHLKRKYSTFWKFIFIFFICWRQHGQACLHKLQQAVLSRRCLTGPEQQLEIDVQEEEQHREQKEMAVQITFMNI